MITADGKKFYVYIEGVRVPALSINISINQLQTTATVGIYAHKAAKAIKYGSLITIFYRDSGLSWDRLLFFGYLTARAYSKIDGADSITLTAHSRAHYFKKISTALAGKMLYTNTTTVVTHKSTGNANEVPLGSTGGDTALGDNTDLVNRAANTGNISMIPIPTGTLSSNNGANETPIIPNNTDSVGVGSSNEQSIATRSQSDATEVRLVENGAALTPSGKIVSSATYKTLILSIMRKWLDESMSSSGPFNKIVYEDRFKYEDYLAELPGGWEEYFYGKGNLGSEASGIDTKAKHKTAITTVIKKYLDRLGSNANMNDIFITLMSLLMTEAYEVAGLFDKALIITPESIYSDIPMCNVIWPDKDTRINYTESSDNYVSRLIFTGQLESTNVGRGQITVKNDGSTETSAALAMYPKALEIVSNLDKKTIANNYNGIIFDTEIYSGVSAYGSAFPLTYLNVVSPQVLEALAKYAYNNAVTSHSSCTVTGHFMPELIAGIRCLVNDGVWRGVGKIVAINHNIVSTSAPTTSIRLSNYQHVDDYKYVVPSWYNELYSPTKVSSLYEAYYGCQSIGSYLGKEGAPMSSLADELNTYYETATMKDYMSSQLMRRNFESQESLFKKLGASATQQDKEGVIIYSGKVFDPVSYAAYTIEGGEHQVTADRQKPVTEYLRAIYGKAAVKT